MSKRAEFDRSPRLCPVDGEWFIPVRQKQKFCPQPKRCVFSSIARKLSHGNPGETICVDCDRKFTQWREDQKKCGDDCPGKPPLIKVCVYSFCAKAFEVDMNTTYGHHQKFCSRSCARKEEVFYKYGMTSASYLQLFKKQNGVCKACNLPPAEGKRFHIDHDHNCCPGQTTCGKCVRALLHERCNQLEGEFKTNPEILRGIANYIESVNRV